MVISLMFGGFFISTIVRMVYLMSNTVYLNTAAKNPNIVKMAYKQSSLFIFRKKQLPYRWIEIITVQLRGSDTQPDKQLLGIRGIYRE